MHSQELGAGGTVIHHRGSQDTSAHQMLDRIGPLPILWASVTLSHWGLSTTCDAASLRKCCMKASSRNRTPLVQPDFREWWWTLPRERVIMAHTGKDDTLGVLSRPYSNSTQHSMYGADSHTLHLLQGHIPLHQGECGLYLHTSALTKAVFSSVDKYPPENV